MTAIASKWFPVQDIDDGFGSLTYSFDGQNLSVVLHGERNLSILFNRVIAIRFEQECPGFDELPKLLPMLKPSTTFPLLKIESSDWLEQFNLIYQGREHFALITADHLLQIIAKPVTAAHWK